MLSAKMHPPSAKIRKVNVPSLAGAVKLMGNTTLAPAANEPLFTVTSLTLPHDTVLDAFRYKKAAQPSKVVPEPWFVIVTVAVPNSDGKYVALLSETV